MRRAAERRVRNTHNRSLNRARFCRSALADALPIGQSGPVHDGTEERPEGRCARRPRDAGTGLIFVTGIAGSGKSTVREELSRRGALAYDTDEDQIVQWTNRVTGKITPLLADLHRTPEFLDQNVWKIDPVRVRQLAEQGEQRAVFLCGSIGNEEDAWPFFARVFLLSIDEATMRRRLVTRTAHDFGTRPHELELLLAWGSVIDEHYRRRGAIIIDATQPPALAVDEILRVLRATS